MFDFLLFRMDYSSFGKLGYIYHSLVFRTNEYHIKILMLVLNGDGAAFRTNPCPRFLANQ